MFRIIGDTNINFIGVRNIAFGVSLLLVALGIFAFVMIVTGHANLGIDFAGGTMIIGTFENPVAIQDLRAAISADFPDAMITQLHDFEKPNAFVIKVKQPETEAEGRERSIRLKEIISTTFSGNAFTVESEHVIGPAVGQTLRSDALKATLLSLAGIVIYIWIRFDFRKGVAATIATFHDVLAVLGLTYILGREFDLLLITALLTLAGYSLTDTVVVFDRIRERTGNSSRKSYVGDVNRSINDVLSRTVMTSLTTLAVVATLFVFGGDVLRTFSLALLLGVIIGTYSSVFVASPIVIVWEARFPQKFRGQ